MIPVGGYVVNSGKRLPVTTAIQGPLRSPCVTIRVYSLPLQPETAEEDAFSLQGEDNCIS